MAQTHINVRMHLPTTAEGTADLREAMARFKAGVLVGALNKLPAPIGEKKAYLAGLNGETPWSNKRQEGNEHGKEKAG